MTESFLHYLWQFQYFDKKDLLTAQGEPLTILKTGILNSNSGPDFFNAKIKIGEIEWVGNVEVHLKSSDWLAHSHEKDQAYNNVVLHVVWENDKPIYQGKNLLPAVELKKRVDKNIIEKYSRLVNSASSIACEKAFPKVSEITKLSTLDKALLQRLENRSR